MRGDQIGYHGDHRGRLGVAADGPDRRRGGERVEGHNGRWPVCRHDLGHQRVGKTQPRLAEQLCRQSRVGGVVDGAPSPWGEPDDRSVEAADAPEQAGRAPCPYRVVQRWREDARILVFEGVGDRLGRAAVAAPSVGEEQENRNCHRLRSRRSHSQLPPKTKTTNKARMTARSAPGPKLTTSR